MANPTRRIPVTVSSAETQGEEKPGIATEVPTAFLRLRAETRSDTCRKSQLVATQVVAAGSRSWLWDSCLSFSAAVCNLNHLPTLVRTSRKVNSAFEM